MRICGGGYVVGFHSRASRCTSAIWSGVIFFATSSSSRAGYAKVGEAKDVTASN
jgi:hypothetical protein